MMEKELPKGWLKVRIDELTKVIGGGTPKTSKPEYYDGDIAWLSPVDLSGYKDKYISRGRKSITELGLQKSAARLMPAGTVVFSSRAPIGYVAIAASELATNQGFKSLLPSLAFDPSYMYYHLQYSRSEIESRGSGTTFTEISGRKLGETEVMLAPLPEQKRIVARLDALFGHLDVLRERLDRIPELLKNFRRQVLTQAVTGKMTEEWRKENPGIEIPNYNSVPSPFKIPSNWKAVPLHSVAEGLKYGSSSKSNSEGDIPVLRMGNLQDGKIDWNGLKYSSDKKEIEKYALKSGDVLFNRTNSPELVGKTSIYKGEQPALYAGYLIKIETNEDLNSEYINYVLNTPYAKAWCWRVKSDGVSQSNINAKKLGAFVLPLPSLKEQEEIVRKVNELFSAADQIKGQYQSLKQKIDKLPQAILGKAFKGELVPQDENDEPAWVLLERIKAENEGKVYRQEERVRMVAEDEMAYRKC